MKSDAPLVMNDDGEWDMTLHAGREVQWGHSFTPGQGYRVMVRFCDSSAANLLETAYALRIARTVRMEAMREGHEQFNTIADAFERMASQVDRLNHHWNAAGRPAEPLDEIITERRLH